MITNAGVLNVLVTASTGQATAALRRSQAEFRATAKTAETSATATRTAWRSVGLGVALVGVAAGKMAVDFDHAMAQIVTQAGAPAGEIDKLRSSVLGLAKASIFGPTDLANALYHVESVGYRGAKAMRVLKKASDAATVGNSDLETTTYALVSALNSGIKGTGNLTKTIATMDSIVGHGDMRMEDFTASLSSGIASAAKTWGISLRQMGAALDTMTASGTPAQAAATRLRMTFSLLGHQSSTAEKALGHIGIKQGQLAEAMQGKQGLIGALDILHSHLQRSGKDAAHQAMILSEAFGGGRTSGAIMQLLNSLDEVHKRYQQISPDPKKFAMKLETAQDTAANRFKSSWSQIQVTLVNLGTALEGPATKAFSIFANAVSGAASVMMGLPPIFGKMTLAAAGGALALLAWTKVIAPIVAVGEATAAIIPVFVSLAASEGLVAAGMFAITTAFEASPFLTVMAGAAALTGAVIGLKAAFGALFGSEHKIPPLQQHLIDSGKEYHAALKDQKHSLDALAHSEDRIDRARKRHHRTSADLKEAERNLGRVLMDEKSSADHVARAEQRVANAKRHDLRASHALTQAEKLHGVQLQAAKISLKSAAVAEHGRIDALKQEQHHLRVKIAADVDNIHTLGNTKKRVDFLNQQEARLTKVQNHLKDATGEYSQTMADANNKVSPEFAKHLKDNVFQTGAFGKVINTTGKHLSNPLALNTHGAAQTFGFMNDKIKQTIPTMDQMSTHIDGTVANRVHHFDQVASKSIRHFQQTTSTAYRKTDRKGDQLLQKWANPLSFGSKPGHQRGAIMVPGAGVGDKVPMFLGAQHVANVEPGELIGIGNKNLAAAISAGNQMVPRFQTGTSFTGMKPAITSLIQSMIGRFGGYLSSGYRTSMPMGHPDYHNYGLAGDYVPNDWAGATRYSNSIGQTLLEGIHASPPGSNVSWKNGNAVDPGFWGSSTWADHHSHIHLATQQAAAVFKALKARQITGPAGQLRSIAQEQQDAITKAINAGLRKAMPQQTGDEGVGYIPAGKGSVMAQMYHVLKAYGANRVGAAGIIGNAYGESNLNPGAVGTGGGGLFGFTTSPISLADLQSFATRSNKPWTDVGLQMQFMLEHGGLGMIPVVNSAGSPENAAKLFMEQWERPGIPRLSVREVAARRAYAAGYRKGTGGTGLGLGHALHHIENTSHPRRRHRTTDRLTEIIGGIKPGDAITKRMRDLTKQASLYDDYAQRAQSLSEYGITHVYGKTESQWLTKRLSTLFNLRNTLLRVHKQMQKRRDQVAKMAKNARNQLHKLNHHISMLKKQQKRMQQEVKQVKKNKDDAVKALEKRIKVAQKHKDHTLVHQLNSQLTTLKGKDAAGELNKRIHHMNIEAKQLGYGKTALTGKIIPALNARAGKLKTQDGNYMTALHEVQGPGGPNRHLSRLPRIGVLGGEILDVQLRLKEIAGAGAGGATSGMSIDQLVSFAQAVSLGAFTHDLPRAHTGGIITPANGQQEMAAILKRGEGVVDERGMRQLVEAAAGGGGDTNVYIEFPESLQWLAQFVDVRVEHNGKKTTGAYRARKGK